MRKAARKAIEDITENKPKSPKPSQEIFDNQSDRASNANAPAVKIAVAKFLDAYGYVTPEGKRLHLLLIPKLSMSKSVTLVEREDIDKVINEQKLGAFSASEEVNDEGK